MVGKRRVVVLVSVLGFSLLLAGCSQLEYDPKGHLQTLAAEALNGNVQLITYRTHSSLATAYYVQSSLTNNRADIILPPQTIAAHLIANKVPSTKLPPIKVLPASAWNKPEALMLLTVVIPLPLLLGLLCVAGENLRIKARQRRGQPKEWAISLVKSGVLVGFSVLLINPLAGQWVEREWLTSITQVLEATQQGQVVTIRQASNSNLLAVQLRDGQTQYALAEPGLPLPDYLKLTGVPADRLPPIERQALPDWTNGAVVVLTLLLLCLRWLAPPRWLALMPASVRRCRSMTGLRSLQPRTLGWMRGV